MRNLILASLLTLTSLNASAFAKDCNVKAGRAALALEAISYPESRNSIKIREVVKSSSKPTGGESLDTYKVYLVTDEDSASIYEVDLTSTDCFLMTVRFVTGD